MQRPLVVVRPEEVDGDALIGPCGAERQETGVETDDLAEAEAAIEALKDLRGHLRRSDPAEAREVFGELVSRIELHYDHEDRGRYTRNRFRRGVGHLRPPKCSLLSETSTV